MAHIIVVGNEKGGSGKSTTCMHVATALVRMGHKVGALDLDLRQRSFGRYVENRRAYARKEGFDLPMPDYRDLPEIDQASLGAGENVYDRRLSAAVAGLEKDAEFIIIDCPGSHTRLSQVAHSLADTLITPLNDSFIDFDLLARVDPDTSRVIGPSIYSEMVWNARQLRARAGLPPIDWIVLRNRLGAQQMHNKRKVGGALEQLSKRIGFRVAHLKRGGAAGSARSLARTASARRRRRDLSAQAAPRAARMKSVGRTVRLPRRAHSVPIDIRRVSKASG